MKKIILLTAFFFCYFQFVYSQGGILDSLFSADGIVTADLGSGYNYPFSANKVLVDSHGSIYIITKTYIAKRLLNGLADSSYGQRGFTSTSKISVNDAALQQDGKIVEVGIASGNFAIVRYNTDGSSDSTFNKNGSVNTKFNDFFGGYINSGAKSVAIQNDGKIVAAGYTVKDGGKYGLNYTLAIARYNVNGSPDKTFSGDGKLMLGYTGAANSLAIQKDGKIVLTSAESYYKYLAVTRISKDGSTDSTFGDGGWFQPTFGPNLVAIRTDGKIVVSGTGYKPDILATYNTDGSPDSTFSEDGIQYNEFGTASFILQNDGKIVIAGASSLLRYNSNGILDSSFSGDGIQQNDFTIASVAFENDGKILSAGSGFARYNTDGSVDNTFNTGGNLPVPDMGNTAFTKVKAQTDGKIVAAGTTWIGSNTKNILVRYNTNGSLDSTFSDDGIKVNRFPITSLVISKNGKIVVTGDSLLACYNTDGRLDSSFGKNGIQHNDFAIQATASQSDGKIVVVGSSSATDDSGADYPGFAVARYNSMGKLDSSFSGDGKLTKLFYNRGIYEDLITLSSTATLVDVQSDKKIVVAGSGSCSDDLDNFYANAEIARFNPDGSFDSSFTGSISSDGYEYKSHPLSMAVGSDGNIVVATVTYSPDYNDVSVKRLGTNNFTVHLPYLNFQNSLVAVQDHGKTIVKGSNLIRLNADGTVDNTFGIQGQQTTEGDVSDITVENNKLITAGAGNDLGNVGVLARYLLDNKTNSSPTVSLTAPADKATFDAPAAHIRLRAIASDTDGTIAKVEFYNGTVLLHTETVFPYGYIWREVPPGNYTLTAKAYDNSGNVTVSAAVHISVVQKPPVITIIEPVNNQSFTAPANIYFKATVSNTAGRIVTVEFFNGNVLLHTETAAPYGFIWKKVPAGTYTVTAVATYATGFQITSEPVIVKVLNASIVSSRPYSENEKTALNDALSLRLSPNPANNIVNIYTSGLQQNKSATLSIISVSGMVLKTMYISNAATQLDVSSFASGVYTIKIVSGDKTLYKQFVKL